MESFEEMIRAQYELATLINPLLDQEYCLKCSKCCKSYFPDKGPTVPYYEVGKITKAVEKNKDVLVLEGKDPLKFSLFIREKKFFPVDYNHDGSCYLFSHPNGKCPIYDSRMITCQTYPALLCPEEDKEPLRELLGIKANPNKLILVDKRCERWEDVNKKLKSLGFETFALDFSDLSEHLDYYHSGLDEALTNLDRLEDSD